MFPERLFCFVRIRGAPLDRNRFSTGVIGITAAHFRLLTGLFVRQRPFRLSLLPKGPGNRTDGPAKVVLTDSPRSAASLDGLFQ